LSHRIVLGQIQEHTDPPHLVLLRPRGERPSGSGTAEKGNELTSFHSITS
jgi:hypothetical protein